MTMAVQLLPCPAWTASAALPRLVPLLKSLLPDTHMHTHAQVCTCVLTCIVPRNPRGRQAHRLALS